MIGVNNFPRFWEKVDIRGPNDCWEWNAGRSQTGYGSFAYRKKRWSAQRFAYHITHPEENLDGYVVRHTCDNPPCCNPIHLIKGTHKSNAKDREDRGRQDHSVSKGPKDSSSCKRGHLWTEANTYLDPKGQRRCITCKRTNLKRLGSQYKRPSNDYRKKR